MLLQQIFLGYVCTVWAAFLVPGDALAVDMRRCTFLEHALPYMVLSFNHRVTSVSGQQQSTSWNELIMQQRLCHAGSADCWPSHVPGNL